MLVVKTVLWALWGLGLLNVVALFVSGWVYEITARSRDAGVVGPQLFFMVLAVVTMPVGSVSGILLILLTDVGAVFFVGLIVGTALLLTLPVLAIASYLHAGWQSYRRSRS